MVPVKQHFFVCEVKLMQKGGPIVCVFERAYSLLALRGVVGFVSLIMAMSDHEQADRKSVV